MYTQCNHCKAIFRVTMKELTAAQGLLRCGECDAIFDAMRSLSTTLPEERRFVQNNPNNNTDEPTEPPKYQAPKVDNATWQGFLQRVKSSFSHAVKSLSTTLSKSNIHPSHPPPSTTRLRKDVHPSQSKPAGSRFFLFLGVGALTLLLLLQLLYSKRNWLALQPLTANATQQTCQWLGCDIAMPRDVRQIKLLSRNVYSHPNTPNVLTISVSIQNEATFSQPYPLIEISFLNHKNEVVALRRFTPEEYLKTKIQELMPINTPSELVLNISDPGKDAVRFQFRFL